VSKLWNSVCLQPELWSELSIACAEDSVVAAGERILDRAQGGLRVLRLAGRVFSSPLWAGAIQRARRGVLRAT
jgi:hypothetical protein